MRPAGLTAVCVICLLMGALGGLALVGGCVGLIAQPLILEVTQSFMRLHPDANTPQFQQQMERQRDVLQETLAVQRPWMPLMILSLLVLTTAVVCLITGAIKGLNLKPMAHRWMIIGMIAAMAHALISGYVGFGTQRDSRAIVMRHVNQTLQSVNAPATPAAWAMVNNAMQVGQTIGMTFIAGWALLKCGMYGTCCWYLLTPKIRRLFESDGSDRSVIEALSHAPT